MGFGFRVGFRDYRVEGLGFKGLGFKGFGIIGFKGLGCKGLGFKGRVWGLGLGLGFKGLGLGVYMGWLVGLACGVKMGQGFGKLL